MSDSEEDEVITARPEDRATVPPDPNAFIRIHIINEHQPELAKSMKLYLETCTYSGRTPLIQSLGAMPGDIKQQLDIDLAIISVDEFTDIDWTIEALKLVYGDRTEFIFHTEYPNDLIESAIADSDARGLCIGYEFDRLRSLVQDVAALEPYTK
ncbi:hypothetical protein IT407_03565 [Candidatus Uhrbacteria bacterium]|nr:hypothetical protein [Candidatus Uhrbacteria bacterium]